MPIMAEQSEQSCVIRLEGEIEIAHAAELKSALVEAIERRQSLELDLGQVCCLDVTAVQLLVAFVRAAAEAGVELRLGAPLPEPLCAALAACGLGALLESKG